MYILIHRFINSVFRLGIEYLIVTNAAGAVNPDYKVGDVMLIKDHINFLGLAGQNPLRGPNDERWGTRFPPMNKAYDREIIKKAMEIAAQLGLEEKSTEECMPVSVVLATRV